MESIFIKALLAIRKKIKNRYKTIVFNVNYQWTFSIRELVSIDADI